MTDYRKKRIVSISRQWFQDCIIVEDYKGDVQWFYPIADKEKAARAFADYAAALSLLGYKFLFKE